MSDLDVQNINSKTGNSAISIADDGTTTVSTFTSTGIDDNATSTAVTIDANENVGIGEASPQTRLHVADSDITAYNGSATDGQLSAGATLFIEQEGPNNNAISQIVMQPRTGFGYNRIVSTGGSSPALAFATNNAERMRIDTSGKLLSPGGSAFVGTVATGSTQGSIIERGSNSNGEYIKFADGTMICTFHGTAVTTSYARVTWSYPQTFLNNVIATTTTNHRDGGDIRGRTVGVSEVYGNNLTRFIYKGVGDADTASIAANLTINVQHFAIGRWY